jgi:hypothetical protein
VKTSIKMKSSVEYLRKRLAALDPDLTMCTIGIEEIQKACNHAAFDYVHMVALAKEMTDCGFDLIPRLRDDFSSTPYLWVTPRPKPLDPKAKHAAPAMCWMGASANGGGPMRIKEGVLIFTKEGYAVGALVKRGVGDIDVRQIPWIRIVESGQEKAAVLDYAEGHPKIIIPAR